MITINGAEPRDARLFLGLNTIAINLWLVTLNIEARFEQRHLDWLARKGWWRP